MSCYKRPSENTTFFCPYHYFFCPPRTLLGVYGVLAGDTCVYAASLLGGCACKNAVPHKLEERLPAAFNAFCGNNPGCSFWGILGDYFYDQAGAANRNFMNRVSDDTKKRVWVGTPGNHDIWMFGGPGTTTGLKGVYLVVRFFQVRYRSAGRLLLGPIGVVGSRQT